jgi:hypothetical protein
MIHPFVRMHVVDMETYKYLAKKDVRVPGVTQLESAAFFDHTKHYTRAFADFIMPIST